MMRLGGKCLHLDVKSSSVKKGESLSDTVSTLLSYVEHCAT